MSTRPVYETNLTERRIITLVHSAIAGGSIAATLELASLETLSPLLLVALGCFAVAIPASIALVILAQVIYELGKQVYPDASIVGQQWPPLSFFLAIIDQLACYTGFLLLFWHFHWIIGSIFLSATALAFITTWMAEKGLRGKKQQSTDSVQDAQSIPE